MKRCSCSSQGCCYTNWWSRGKMFVACGLSFAHRWASGRRRDVVAVVKAAVVGRWEQTWRRRRHLRVELPPNSFLQCLLLRWTAHRHITNTHTHHQCQCQSYVCIAQRQHNYLYCAACTAYIVNSCVFSRHLKLSVLSAGTRTAGLWVL